ncbi:protein kinase [Tsukamurella sp. NPDC003166]|uniref:serine/threonine-protein kinase n=1 Tax=Tsukamurella sp. NPDC003166 TaxID=3154444 RepID=UPI0033A1B265
MLESGQEFAGYRIERMLGAGGMGEVYVARHPRLPRSDALKVLAPQFAADPQFRARFEREADLASSLSHPAIVKVFDRGEFEGRLWIAMELVDGVDLSCRLREQGRLPPQEVGETVAAVAGALDYAAGRGLVHRDVKPANILLSSGGHVMLTDFGIARMGSESSDLTGTGVTVGTLNYASPEQLRGEQLDGRSDQYSLACTAYQLLAGEAPFQNSNAAIVIGSHLTAPAPSVRAARPDLSPRVDVVFARGMAKDPEGRFASSVEFAAALNDALRDGAVPVPPTVSSIARTTARSVPEPDDPERTHVRGQLPDGAPTQLRGQQLEELSPRSRSRGRAKGWGIAAAAVAALLVVTAGGYAGYRWWRPADPAQGLTRTPTAEAAALPRTSVSSLLPSLERKPDGWRWRVATGPTTLTFLAADEKTAVFQGGTADQRLVVVVDAATGKIRRSPIPYAGPNYRCAVHASVLACMDARSGTLLDLETGALTRLSDAKGPEVGFLGDNIVTVGAAGDSATVYRPDGTVAWRLEGKTVKVYPKAGMAVAVTSPAASDPFAKGQIRFLAADGRVVLQRDVGQNDSPKISGSASGVLFTTATASGALQVVDRNGAVKDVEAGWNAAYDDCNCDSPESPLPVVYKEVGGSLVLGTVNPATGNVLWARNAFEVKGGSRTITLRVFGAATNVVAMRDYSAGGSTGSQSVMFDAYTGAGGSLFLGAATDFVGTDGQRALTTGNGWFGMTPVGPVGLQEWRVSSDGGSGLARAGGGGLYFGNGRVL